jgi:hypothetical protein
MNQRTFRTLARDNIRALGSAFQRRIPAREQKVTLGPFPRVAFVAIVHQDRFDVPSEINLPGCWRRELRFANGGEGKESDNESLRRDAPKAFHRQLGFSLFHASRITHHVQYLNLGSTFDP